MEGACKERLCKSKIRAALGQRVRQYIQITEIQERTSLSSGLERGVLYKGLLKDHGKALSKWFKLEMFRWNYRHELVY